MQPESSADLEAVSQQEIDEAMLVALESLAGSRDGCEPAALRKYLPPMDGQTQHFVLVELIKMSMAMASDVGEPLWLDDYFEALSDLISPETAPLDLVMEEIQLKLEHGLSADRKHYLDRFPQFDSVLDPLLITSEATTAKPKLQKPEPLAADTLIDDFQIIRMLGQGVFAQVYLARQLSMARLVALKVSTGTGDEPKALAQFDHPNIVRVFDQRGLPSPPVHLLYMQFHPGGTLGDVVPQVKALRATSRNSQEAAEKLTGAILLESVDRNLLLSAQIVPDRSALRTWVGQTSWPSLVAWMGVQLARALEEAHELGVLHRDVKPANVLLTAEGVPQLADFNVSMAGAAGRAGAASTFGGSVGYMSPEHLRAINTKLMAPVDAVQEPADLYSLAVLLWELWQGQRPFDCPNSAASWTQLIHDQSHSRGQALREPQREETGSQRVLERVLRDALSVDPDSRPASGAVMAGRLRLALHPEAAKLFEPEGGSLIDRLRNVSPWWIAGISILIPHFGAGWFNYEYNHSQIMTEATRAGLDQFALWVNSFAFPIAIVLIVWYTRTVVRAWHKARRGESASKADLTATLDLGHRAAMIGGACWITAGVIYPVLLSWRFADFTLTQAWHFFASLLICGGVAMIYPLFSLALITSIVYYPQMVRPSMQEPSFDQHAQRLLARSETYLLIAALIPLLGAALLVFSESESRGFLLTAIGAGVLGLLASFFAHKQISQTWTQLSAVLSNRKGAVPGWGE